MKQLHRFIVFGILLAATIAALGLPVNSSYILIPFVILSFLVLLPKDMLKNPRILIWILLIIVSVVLLGINISQSGYSVAAISKNSTLSNIAIGEVVYKINDVPVAQDSFLREYQGTIKFETNRGTKFERANGTLGLE